MFNMTIKALTACTLILITLGCSDKDVRLAENIATNQAQDVGMALIEIKSTQKLSDSTYLVKGQGTLKGSYSDSLGNESFTDYYTYNKEFKYYVNIKSGQISYNMPSTNSSKPKINNSEPPENNIPAQSKHNAPKIQYSGEAIKNFKVNYKVSEESLLIKVDTDLPDGASLMFDITKKGLKDNDSWIGNDAKARVKNGKAEVNIPLTTHLGGKLGKGFYNISIMFSSFWMLNKNVDIRLKEKIGKFGKNLKTPYNGTEIRGEKKYKTIEYLKKSAFSIS